MYTGSKYRLQFALLLALTVAGPASRAAMSPADSPSPTAASSAAQSSAPASTQTPDPSATPSVAPQAKPATAQATALQSRWQYRRLNALDLQSLDPKKEGSQERALNVLGAAGWELVAVTPGVPKPSSVTAADRDGQSPVYYVDYPVFFFKRPAQ
jgi:hypothetical protein